MHGIFDSGVGGLSLWRHFKEHFPNAPFLYFADQAHLPYGNLPLELSYLYVSDAIEKMIELGATSISLACHTVSTNHAKALKKRFSIPIFDIASYSLLDVKEKSIIVIGTEATIRSNYYQNQLGPALHYARSCPELVPMIERGETDQKIIKSSLSKIPEGGDALVLACTHYPFIAQEISSLFPALRVVDPAISIVKRIDFFESVGEDLFFTTGSPETFHSLACRLLKTNLSFPFFIKPLQCRIKPAVKG